MSNSWFFVDGALQPLWDEGAQLSSEEQIQRYLRDESEQLRGILQDSEEIDENLTDNDDDAVSDNESESDQYRFFKSSDNFLIAWTIASSFCTWCSKTSKTYYYYINNYWNQPQKVSGNKGVVRDSSSENEHVKLAVKTLKNTYTELYFY